MSAAGSTNDLPAAAAQRTGRVAVVGQGYVGLTLASAAAAAGFPVTGIDNDVARIDALTRGELAVPGVDRVTFDAAIQSGGIRFAGSADAVADAAFIFICVPTPLRDGAPDLSYVEAAGRSVAAHLRAGAMVVLESTTYPGTTDQLLQPLLEQGSGLRAGVDFLLAYSPERIDPGSAEFTMRNTPRVVGGTTPEATDAAVAFYEQLVDKVFPVSSTRTAETAKLLENTFRHINVALVNELTMLTHDLDIDVWEVIDAASTKPFGFMPFYPGPGIGGHCIPLDPTYLSWQVRRQTGRRFGVLEAAQDVNERMPNYVASRVAEILNDVGRAVRGSKIFVLGVTYKADVGDVRESPSLMAMQALYRKGAEISFHDPFIEEVPLNGGRIRRTELAEGLATADLVLLLTPHSSYDVDQIAEHAALVFDTRNAYGDASHDNVIRL
ncbi:MAG TPA: nucleotide sugar dehydrogenase [Actinomycetota bacterium]|nr:nucleotide sugar dehydrogenase [Actinomycetota bacterium]